MNFDKAIAILNDLLSKKKPEIFNSSWIVKHAPQCYRFFSRKVRDELGGIDWDKITYALEWKYQRRWSPGWFFFHKDVVTKATADYFIFLVYVIEEKNKKGRRVIEPHVIIIPTKVLQNKSKLYKRTYGNERWCYFIWINPKYKKAFDYRDQEFDLSEYLDKAGFALLNKEL